MKYCTNCKYYLEPEYAPEPYCTHKLFYITIEDIVYGKFIIKTTTTCSSARDTLNKCGQEANLYEPSLITKFTSLFK